MAAKLWWMIHKDLVSEFRACRAWPAMLLLGTVVAVVFGVQMDLAPDEKRRMVGGLLWLAVLLGGMLAVDRSFASEREEGCWDALLLYPVSPATVYLAKLLVNVMALAALQCVLVPLFVVLSDVPLVERPGALLLAALLGNLGIAAVGTLVSGLAAGLRQGSGLLLVLVLPLAIPVVLAAAEATRLMVDGDLGPAWWRWIGLLGTFAVVFVTAGLLFFDFAVEE